MSLIRFVLLSTSRSGSSFLRSMLDAHPRVRCSSEFYCYDYQFWDFEEVKTQDPEGFAAIRALHVSDPIQFIEEYGFRSDDRRVKASGFTLMYDQPMTSRPAAVWDWLAANTDIRVIDLRRRDELLRYVSFMRAMMTQSWVRVSQSAASPRSKPVHVDPDAFLGDVARLTEQRDTALKRFAGHPILSVSYEALSNETNRELARIFDFLGVKPMRARPTTVKQRESDPRAYISNYDELRAVSTEGRPRRVVLTDDVLARLRTALLETHFKGSPVEKQESEAAQRELNTILRHRFDICRKWFVPWLRSHGALDRMHVVDVDCFLTGFCTAAVALDATRVDAYGVAGPNLDAARRRFEIMGLENVGVHEHALERKVETIEEHHPPGTVDCVILYESLHRFGYSERQRTLQMSWTLVRPGGLMVVASTPNRLTALDETSGLPFFHALPDELAVDYAARSPQEGFSKTMADARSRSLSSGLELLFQWGRSVSYHEFELVLGALEPLIIGDGFDPEPLSHLGVPIETRLLYTYVRRKGLTIPPAFLRATIEVIFRKPGGASEDTEVGPPRDLDAIVRPLVDAPSS